MTILKGSLIALSFLAFLACKKQNTSIDIGDRDSGNADSTAILSCSHNHNPEFPACMQFEAKYKDDLAGLCMATDAKIVAKACDTDIYPTECAPQELEDEETKRKAKYTMYLIPKNAKFCTPADGSKPAVGSPQIGEVVEPAVGSPEPGETDEPTPLVPSGMYADQIKVFEALEVPLKDFHLASFKDTMERLKELDLRPSFVSLKEATCGRLWKLKEEITWDSRIDSLKAIPILSALKKADVGCASIDESALKFKADYDALYNKFTSTQKQARVNDKNLVLSYVKFRSTSDILALCREFKKSYSSLGSWFVDNDMCKVSLNPGRYKRVMEELEVLLHNEMSPDLKSPYLAFKVQFDFFEKRSITELAFCNSAADLFKSAFNSTQGNDTAKLVQKSLSTLKDNIPNCKFLDL